VRDNIMFGEERDPHALDDALHVSGLDEVSAGLPLGLDTPLSERGFNLSGGQRQRLALARAIYAARRADSSLLLLDEPTSALDPVTEGRVLRRLDQAFGRSTLVAAVHRMNLLAHFDRVLLMQGGRVIDSGSVADLLERQDSFRALVHEAARRKAVDGQPTLNTGVA
jgi:ABC-type bacteriocin/lantibiotic exporter with double-glycine peptidase domain